MTDASTPLPPAGWYRDPAGGAAPRWWNGTEWAPANTVPADATPLPNPAPAATTPAATIPSAATVGPATNYTPAPTRELSDAATSTWQIWVLVLLPLIVIPGQFAIDVSTWFPVAGEDPFAAQLRQYSDPGYLLTLATGWLVYGLSIPLAIFDRRALSSRGVDRPFHWAFVFLGAIVYVIGRSVVVRRRTGQGLGPLWAAIAVQLIALAAGIILMVSVFSEMANFMSDVPF